MRKHLFLTAGVLAVISVCAFADTRLEFPGDIPGPPAYAQISYLPQFGEEIYHTEEWAAIPFYYDPSCVPTDFNLLNYYDTPRVFGCGSALRVQGFVILPGAEIRVWGMGAVPIYFVSWPQLRAAVADGVLTITELSALPSLRIGSASFFSLVLHPSGAKTPHIEISARGVLQDGKQFQLQVAGGDQSALVKHIKIVLP